MGGRGDFSEKFVSETIAAGVTERSWGLRDHKEFECSEPSEDSEESRMGKKKTNQNGMLIFGHNGIKGFKTKGVKKGVSSIINAQS